MIEVTETIKADYPEAFCIARHDRMTVKWLEDDLVFVARRAKGHGRYQVYFKLLSNGRLIVGCKNLDGVECEGMKHRGLCAHAAAVLLRSVAKAKTKEDREAA